MRSILAALLVCCATAAIAGEPPTDGPVAAGGFGMSGADYYGDMHSRMPFTREDAPRPAGIADVERAQVMRKRADGASRRRSPHG